MNNPKVSVIIPTYNREKMVQRAIRSVRNQTYKDFELIVVDDGSTDNTEFVIKRLQEQDDRIRFIKHEKNKGPAAARNTGIKTARGEYIAFQDSDNEWLPKKLEKQMEMLEATPPEVGVNYTAFWKIRGNKKFYIPSPNTPYKDKDGYISDTILTGPARVNTPCTIVKKQVFEKVGMFDENIHISEEWELSIRISKHFRFQFIDEPLVIATYTGEDNISTNRSLALKAHKMMFKKHYNGFEKNKKAKANILYTIGNDLCQMGKVKEGKRYLVKSIRIMPTNVEHLTATILAFFGRKAYKGVSKIRKKLIGWS